MGEVLKLNKGDSAYLCVMFGVNGVYGGYKFETVTVAQKRTQKNGRATYFVEREGGVKVPYSFNWIGDRNFKTWQEAAWSNHPQRLFDNVKAAKAFCAKKVRDAKKGVK